MKNAGHEVTQTSTWRHGVIPSGVNDKAKGLNIPNRNVKRSRLGTWTSSAFPYIILTAPCASQRLLHRDTQFPSASNVPPRSFKTAPSALPVPMRCLGSVPVVPPRQRVTPQSGAEEAAPTTGPFRLGKP